ncbi:PREDICTED: receptor-transporting protein 3-like [Tinamus guttatus]|uniref:receptor-transporting protein 3-like n=1 Tax=Tinamus guttatus TaxID=94827 RepID=UPI00052ECFF0|nr:PREDICTED: receptor-transporting protein 3-like [Tinamus guttatus]
MENWQNIFMEKLRKKHITEPWKLLEDNTIQVNTLKPGWTEHMQRSAFGRFRCSRCCHSWSSAKVHILFHMGRSQSSGKVRMRIFRQACRECPDGPLEEPNFSQENLARILENLVLVMLRECYHVPVQASDFTEVTVEALVTGPHDSTRCEACRLGVCRKPRPARAASTHVEKASSHHTRREQGLRQQVNPTRSVPSFSNTSRRKRYCCIGVCLLCVLAVLLFLMVYFIIN